MHLYVNVKDLVGFKKFLREKGLTTRNGTHMSMDDESERENWYIEYEGKKVGKMQVDYLSTHSLQMPIIGKLIAEALEKRAKKIRTPLSEAEARALVQRKLEEKIPEALRGYWEVPLKPVQIDLQKTIDPTLIEAIEKYSDGYPSKEIGQHVEAHLKTRDSRDSP